MKALCVLNEKYMQIFQNVQYTLATAPAGLLAIYSRFLTDAWLLVLNAKKSMFLRPLAP